MVCMSGTAGLPLTVRWRAGKKLEGLDGLFMTALLEERRAPAAEWARRLGAFSTALFLTSAFSHRLGVLETVPFFWLLGLCFLLGLSGFVFAAVGLAQIWEHGISGLKDAALGAFLSLLVLSPYAVSAYRMAVYPWLNDISTDVARPPQLSRAASLRKPPMNPVQPTLGEGASRQARAYPELAGRRYEYPQETVLETVRELVTDRGWRLLSPVSPVDGLSGTTVEAEAHSFLLGLPADVAIRVEERGDATFVDMRSASRFGRHDLGENAMRIERFLNDLDERIEALGQL